MQIFDEVKRVLKKTGSCFVNLGDIYGGSNCGYGQTRESSGFQNVARQTYYATSKNKSLMSSLTPKSLVGIPEMFVLAMQRRGWIRRNTIIWYKRNCMPSSAQDRFTVDFEYVYFFTKSQKYFFERQFEKHLDITKPQKFKSPETPKDKIKTESDGRKSYSLHKWGAEIYNPQGRNKRTVWKIDEEKFEIILNGSNGENIFKTCNIPLSEILKCFGHWFNRTEKKTKTATWDIPTTAFPGSHFAVFPEDLVKTPILATCPEFICKRCGKVRVKIYEHIYKGFTKSGYNDGYGQGKHLEIPNQTIHGDFIGYSDCFCPEPKEYESGIVLDPFMGSGTVGVVTLKLRRRFIGIEIKPEYVAMAEKRLKPLLAQERLEM